MINLAAIKGENRDLVMTMNARLEATIKAEIGVDDGCEMPNLKDINWTLNNKGRETILD
jgi:hypothetical protein